MSKQKSKNKTKDISITEEQAEDMFVRFFLNMPPDAISNLSNFSIQLENAFYYFLNVHKGDHKTDLKPNIFLKLTESFFNQVPQLKRIKENNPSVDIVQKLSNLHTRLRDQAVSCGCICYNHELTHVLIVCHSSMRIMYSFPKGKMNEGESFMETAARETLEETGVDVSPYITDKYMFTYPRPKKSDVVMFHVKDVPMDLSKKLKSPSPLEISIVEWIPIEKLGINRNNFAPDPPTKSYIIPRVKKFVEEQKKLL